MFEKEKDNLELLIISRKIYIAEIVINTVKVNNFFQVIIQAKTYLNMFYLLFSFFLGIFYFTFLVTGLSLGLGLVFTLFGIPILFGTLLLWRVFAGFESQLTKIMLGINISFVSIKQSKTIWGTIKSYLNDSFTWKSLVYLFIKFPLGIISFVVLITLISVSLSLIATPILFYLTKIGILSGTFCIGSSGICFINSYFAAIIVGIIGVFLLFVFLHALNGLAYISGLFAKLMLENKK